mmetsp:Transcript_42147/g.75417  ORF Transcript_42147/g.75417 Transcript_42147/m.75417 type:complete len:189 (-) Transcript_42147:69-635(-)
MAYFIHFALLLSGGLASFAGDIQDIELSVSEHASCCEICSSCPPLCDWFSLIFDFFSEPGDLGQMTVARLDELGLTLEQAGNIFQLADTGNLPLSLEQWHHMLHSGHEIGLEANIEPIPMATLQHLLDVVLEHQRNMYQITQQLNVSMILPRSACEFSCGECGQEIYSLQACFDAAHKTRLACPRSGA